VRSSGSDGPGPGLFSGLESAPRGPKGVDVETGLKVIRCSNVVKKSRRSTSVTRRQKLRWRKRVIFLVFATELQFFGAVVPWYGGDEPALFLWLVSHADFDVILLGVGFLKY
jgi:hypothetical protein